MAGYKVKGWFGRLKVRIQHRRIRRKKLKEGKELNMKAGRKPFLTGGVWIDNEDRMYNCLGKCIGKWQGFQKEEEL